MENQMRQDPNQSHCYTNPSFCRQSEYIANDNDLPPPPQFQVDDLPPPPDVHDSPMPANKSLVAQPQPQYGQTNPAFVPNSPENDHHHQPPQHQTQQPQEHHTSLQLQQQQQLLQQLQQQQHLQQQQQQHQHQQQLRHNSVANLNQTSHAAIDRYCYIDEAEPSPAELGVSSHKRFGSLPPNRLRYYNNNRPLAADRYEYIQDETPPAPAQQQPRIVQANNSTAGRYAFVEQQQLQQRSATTTIQRTASVRSYRTAADARYASMQAPDGAEASPVRQPWHEMDEKFGNASRRQISTPRGRYTSIPLQDDDPPPSLPERNNAADLQLVASPPRGSGSNNLATQKLHEILTTPRKPRTPRGGPATDPMLMQSPRQQQVPVHQPTTPRGAFTPGCSPSSAAAHRAMSASRQQLQMQSGGNTPLSPGRRGPGSLGGPQMTSTPNKDHTPSARRCLPLNAETPYGRSPVTRQQQQQLQQQTPVSNGAVRYHGEGLSDEVIYGDRKKQASGFYQSVESAFIARTAVPPLSPPTSEANTTLVSATEKADRKNAPLILFLVGVLTCGLSIYLSYAQGRRYYFDSAISCGACCAVAGACRSMRRTWTGLGLAGLSALSCAGLLLLAAKAPRPGTPLHDVTAGALCGVSVLGAVLALLALISPRCTFGRHRRVHSWIPRFSP
ncbi:putative uncharacterized protein DDB_G0291608 isoform X2 [Trichogramma pretiosum]|uniref:putative uncharacterized protein DDB_G0291608 isoform X2 n=1 Tax=Trichogramma pretiosum TaxID=7493 RepID=UPI000C71A4CA|nr:putative uncharacterized protein DDB_G0291608 isoform X2 [Trichogramma pretiosum]